MKNYIKFFSAISPNIVSTSSLTHGSNYSLQYFLIHSKSASEEMVGTSPKSLKNIKLLSS